MMPGMPAVLLDTPQGSIPLKYSIEEIPERPDDQVVATIARMNQYVCEDCQSGPIQYDAQCAITLDPNNPLAAVHAFVRSRLEFCRDEVSARPFEHLLPKNGYFVEALNRPVDVSLKFAATGQKVKGDCDCFCMYCAALLRALGIECCFATVGAEEKDPTVFSHIYMVVYWRGQRIPMDCSHGPYVGWETQNLYGKYQEWAIVDRKSWGLVGMGMLLAGWWAWRNRESIRELFA